MTERRRYRNLVFDSARWDGFVFRPGDIVISTPPKCGTTWTQMLCAMLVLHRVEFDRPLARISPWLDMQTRPVHDVVRDLDAQTHRRIIKTHTPLDGLPYDEQVTYLCVGRDPRDAGLSFEHHMQNLDMQALMQARAQVVGLADLGELGPPPAPPSPDPKERFWAWTQEQITSAPAPSLVSVLHHLSTFWDARERAQVALFHYSDLLADLPGELRRLGDVLGIDVPESRLLEYAAAGSFDRMKDRADELAPNVDSSLWHSNREFFHRGRSGQWRDLLSQEDLRRYQQRVAELVPPDLARWAHQGGPPDLTPKPPVPSQVRAAPLPTP